MEEIKNYGLQEYIDFIKPKDIYSDQVIVMELSGSEFTVSPQEYYPFRFDAFSSILVCRGEMIVTLDYMQYTLTKHMVLERSNLQLMNDIRVSHDFKGYHLILGKSILRNLFEEIIAIPQEYALGRRLEPVLKLEVSEFNMLVDILERLRSNIRRTDHFFQKALILNEVRNFSMELTNISMQKVANKEEEVKINHLEDLTVRFLQLLVQKCKDCHEVSDYSTELCVTPVYLSRTVKSVTGRTAMEWLNNARIAEAKILLRRHDTTIQEIADVLNFSDQSAFGKFFKKHTKRSPVEYRRILVENK